jgi:hypothetical protein
VKFTLRRDGENRGWPNYLLWGRMRTSTIALIVVFFGTWWLYATYQPPAPATTEQPAQVVPPGFVPDPEYTWVPRTNVQETTRTTPTTTTTTSTTETTTEPTTTTTAPTDGLPTTVVDPDGPGPLPPTTLTPTTPTGPSQLPTQTPSTLPTTPTTTAPGPLVPLR